MRARDLHPRGPGGGDGRRAAVPGRTTGKLVAQVEELEHKSRRQDVLVDDELIFAFYDQQLPADVCSGASLERGTATSQAPAQFAAAQRATS